MIKILINANKNEFHLECGGTIATVTSEFMQVTAELYNSIKEADKDVAKIFIEDIKMFFQFYDFDATAEANAKKVAKIAEEHTCKCKENKANTENKNTLSELEKLKNAIDKAIKDDLSPEEFLKEVKKAVNK